MGCCSSDCFVYFILSIALAFMAISTTLRSPPDSEPTIPIAFSSSSPSLSLNASNTLRQSNFKAIATLLHISPEIFLSSSPNTTLFAIEDASFFNTSSLHPLFLKQLLHYHTLPLMLSMDDLLKKPQGTCLPTLLHHKSVQISTVNQESRTAEVNHVRITHPDMFLGDSLVIHGVIGPFSPLQPHSDHLIHTPLCQSDTTNKTSNNEEVPVSIDWTRIVQLLSSNGFVPFAIGLHSVLNRIVNDHNHHKNLTGVTILATPNLVSLSSASPFLYEVVRHHILVQRLTYKDFASMSDKATVKTLDPYQDLTITRRNVNSSGGDFMISGVEIVDPDMFSSSNFVIHGISHTLEIPHV
ncbi:unnamed protein product [Arabidopsis thaliana]|uniref:Fasciclin-like arabinogalactan protein 21 n=2 Tax=Arabidopsis thaliana TaxID=3702 RepID=FLA21_ARATH|nr:FASCICLIN-like arabinogalactan protein 21 precursor [Arabidopsis thaliana]Q9FL53.1 RecName: Full=Fasciclin-like arabinogalactan protein 21; Flags: Precursor [Arabidopsis thaliana]AED91082.1 FASCICLIN-like arabinogalactan protein 21 precursor [Arabidopsis thaliana]CAA0401137.1 unnamed protein product [Arabidopsis thaliana]CAD5331029.1 unnamed protein product [Arabidopsis thaliana]BAB11150.1 unnamed protein product [Arabidopsis thaliana]|eukprot:NP_196309.1 FASCICLIN-like arabinogalactan protein 21 precursor [Arabidopsis thaliana]